MTLINAIYTKGSINKAELKTFLLLANPFAPHITEEVNSIVFENEGMLANAQWPQFDEAKCADSTVEIAVQVCSKIKARINVSTTATEDEVFAQCLENEDVKKALEGMTIIKKFYKTGSLVNFVAKPM